MSRLQRLPTLAILTAGLALAACGASQTSLTPAPGSIASSAMPSPATSAPLAASGAPTSPGVASAAASSTPAASAASAAPSQVAPATPSPTVSAGFSAPPAAATRTYTCTALISVMTLYEKTGVYATYVDLAKYGGTKPPPLAKGETKCYLLGSTMKGGKSYFLSEALSVFTGPSRSVVDPLFEQALTSGQTVGGVGDQAIFSAANQTLIWYRGGTGFEIQLQAFPTALYSTAKALAVETAIAKAMLAHLK
jgi:hypothetical protein